MTAAGVIARGRAFAEQQMADTFTAYGLPTWTKVDGIEDDSRAAQYDTRGKVSGRSQQGDTVTRTERVGTVEREVLEGGLHIPLAAGVPAVGWEYECTATGPGSDPALLGRRYRVVSVPMKSYATARRLDVVEVPQEA